MDVNYSRVDIEICLVDISWKIRGASLSLSASPFYIGRYEHRKNKRSEAKRQELGELDA